MAIDVKFIYAENVPDKNAQIDAGMFAYDTAQERLYLKTPSSTGPKLVPISMGVIKLDAIDALVGYDSSVLYLYNQELYYANNSGNLIKVLNDTAIDNVIDNIDKTLEQMDKKIGAQASSDKNATGIYKLLEEINSIIGVPTITGSQEASGLHKRIENLEEESSSNLKAIGDLEKDKADKSTLDGYYTKEEADKEFLSASEDIFLNDGSLKYGTINEDGDFEEKTDGDPYLVLTLKNSQVISIPAAELVDTYTVADGDTIDLTLTGHEITAEVKPEKIIGNSLGVNTVELSINDIDKKIHADVNVSNLIASTPNASVYLESVDGATAGMPKKLTVKLTEATQDALNKVQSTRDIADNNKTALEKLTTTLSVYGINNPADNTEAALGEGLITDAIAAEADLRAKDIESVNTAIENETTSREAAIDTLSSNIGAYTYDSEKEIYHGVGGYFKTVQSHIDAVANDIAQDLNQLAETVETNKSNANKEIDKLATDISTLTGRLDNAGSFKYYAADAETGEDAHYDISDNSTYFGAVQQYIDEESAERIAQDTALNESINTINTVTIPGVEKLINNNTETINTINTATIPAVKKLVDDNTEAINTINTVTVPEVEKLINDNTEAINAINTVTILEIQNSIDAINTTAIPALEKAISDLGGEAEGNTVASNTEQIKALAADFESAIKLTETDDNVILSGGLVKDYIDEIDDTLQNRIKGIEDSYQTIAAANDRFTATETEEGETKTTVYNGTIVDAYTEADENLHSVISEEIATETDLREKENTTIRTEFAEADAQLKVLIQKNTDNILLNDQNMTAFIGGLYKVEEKEGQESPTVSGRIHDDIVAVQNDLNAKHAALVAEDVRLAGLIEDEASARETANNTLHSTITSEREAEEANLLNEIHKIYRIEITDSEIEGEQPTSAPAGLLHEETLARQAADQVIRDDFANADQGLQNQINALSGTRGDNTIESNASAIGDLDSRIGAIEDNYVKDSIAQEIYQTIANAKADFEETTSDNGVTSYNGKIVTAYTAADGVLDAKIDALTNGAVATNTRNIADLQSTIDDDTSGLAKAHSKINDLTAAVKANFEEVKGKDNNGNETITYNGTIVTAYTNADNALKQELSEEIDRLATGAVKTNTDKIKAIADDYMKASEAYTVDDAKAITISNITIVTRESSKTPSGLCLEITYADNASTKVYYSISDLFTQTDFNTKIANYYTKEEADAAFLSADEDLFLTSGYVAKCKKGQDNKWQEDGNGDTLCIVLKLKDATGRSEEKTIIIPANELVKDYGVNNSGKDIEVSISNDRLISASLTSAITTDIQKGVDANTAITNSDTGLAAAHEKIGIIGTAIKSSTSEGDSYSYTGSFDTLNEDISSQIADINTAIEELQDTNDVYVNTLEAKYTPQKAANGETTPATFKLIAKNTNTELANVDLIDELNAYITDKNFATKAELDDYAKASDLIEYETVANVKKLDEKIDGLYNGDASSATGIIATRLANIEGNVSDNEQAISIIGSWSQTTNEAGATSTTKSGSFENLQNYIDAQNTAQNEVIENVSKIANTASASAGANGASITTLNTTLEQYGIATPAPGDNYEIGNGLIKTAIADAKTEINNTLALYGIAAPETNANAVIGDGLIQDALDTKMDKKNPTGTGSFSLNRKTGTNNVGTNSVAIGTNITASGNYSFAEGYGTIASGEYSHAEGVGTIAFGQSSHAEGYGTTISVSITGAASATTYTLSAADGSIKAGQVIEYNNVYAKINTYNSSTLTITVDKTLSDSALSNVSAKIFRSSASGHYAHAEGSHTIASGLVSHAEGSNTIASGNYSHAEGSYTDAQGVYSHAEGQNSLAAGNAAHAEGYYTITKGNYSHAEGNYTTASSQSQHVQGEYNILDTAGATSIRGTYAHIVGNGTSASSRSNAHTLDWSGNAWFAGDVYVGSTSGTNKDDGSVALMKSVNPTGTGYFSLNRKAGTTIGTNSFAEGSSTTASGNSSHAEGKDTVAKGDYSHASGEGTQAIGNCQTVIGHYNVTSNTDLFIIGNGTESTPSNAMWVTSEGHLHANKVYGSVWNDYAEYRSTYQKIRPGMCVYEKGNGKLVTSYERMMPGANIVSDTFGFAIGETTECKTPIAVSGRVLAYPFEERDTYKPGDAVCSGPNGTISKMTRAEIREYPERIVGTVSEIPTYDSWGPNNIQVDGRIWIKVR